jgi:hypothetical protein
MNTYTIKRIVEQLFEVEAEDRHEALRKMENPYSVKVIKETILSEAAHE